MIEVFSEHLMIFGVEESLLNKISSYIQRLIYYIHIFVGIYSCVCLFIRVKYF